MPLIVGVAAIVVSDDFAVRLAAMFDLMTLPLTSLAVTTKAGVAAVVPRGVATSEAVAAVATFAFTAVNVSDFGVDEVKVTEYVLATTPPIVIVTVAVPTTPFGLIQMSVVECEASVM